MRLLASAPTHHFHQQHSPSIAIHKEAEADDYMSTPHQHQRTISGLPQVPATAPNEAPDTDTDRDCQLLSSSAPAAGSDGTLAASELLRQLFPDCQPPRNEPREGAASNVYAVLVLSYLLIFKTCVTHSVLLNPFILIHAMLTANFLYSTVHHVHVKESASFAGGLCGVILMFGTELATRNPGDQMLTSGALR